MQDTLGDSFHYTYDPVGNRLSATHNGSTTSQTFDAADQVNGQTYDLNGQLRNDGTHAYTYDALGRMVLADGIGYTSNGDGVLVGRTAAGQTSTYAQDVGGALSQRLFAQTGSTRTTYFQGLTPLAEQTGTNPRAWYLRDTLGSVHQTFGDSGALLPSPTVRYDPFGAVRAGTPPDHGFTGENWDAATGLVNLRARWYDPAHGTFTSRDPFGGSATSPASQHPYQYAANSPAQYTDPSGKCIGFLGGADTWFCAVVAGAVIGGLIDYGSQVYRNYRGGYRGWDMFTHVCIDELLIAIASGAVMGGTAFVLAPLLAPVAELGWAGSFFAGATEGALVNGTGTIASNTLSGRAWNTGLREAYTSGYLGGGMLGGLGGIWRSALRSQPLGIVAPGFSAASAGDDLFDEAYAAYQKARQVQQAIGHDWPTIAATANDALPAHSGWGRIERRLRSDLDLPSIRLVKQLADDMDFTLLSNARDLDFPGQFYASHAEVQKAALMQYGLLPKRPIGVSIPLCNEGQCQRFFSRLAQYTDEAWVIADEKGMHIFEPIPDSYYGFENIRPWN